MSLGSVLPGCLSSAASHISVACWLFKPCAIELEKASLSCGDVLQPGLHSGDAAFMVLFVQGAQGAGFLFLVFTKRSAGGKLKQNDVLFLGPRFLGERKDETPLVGKKC